MVFQVGPFLVFLLAKMALEVADIIVNGPDVTIELRLGAEFLVTLRTLVRTFSLVVQPNMFMQVTVLGESLGTVLAFEVPSLQVDRGSVSPKVIFPLESHPTELACSMLGAGFYSRFNFIWHRAYAQKFRAADGAR